MTTISIIGSGNMARTIGSRAARHGHTVELLSRNTEAAEAVAAEIGGGATVGTFGERPTGDIVIVAVLYQGAVEAVGQFGDALAGKILIDISNPFNAEGNGVVTGPGDSIADRIARVFPGSHVVKAFNTIFRGMLEGETALDAFYAGDSVEAKAEVAAFLESLGFRGRDAGGLDMAHALEWAGILLVGLAGNGAGFDVALKAEVR